MKLKNILLYTLLIFVSFSVFAQKHKGPINWLSLEEADSLYKIQPRPMFIDVYTDWCGWCKRMDASTFQDEAIGKYLNENFYPVKLDAETKDTINFLGREFTNTQSVKVKELLSQIDDQIKLKQDTIKNGLHNEKSTKKFNDALNKKKAQSDALDKNTKDKNNKKYTEKSAKLAKDIRSLQDTLKYGTLGAAKVNQLKQEINSLRKNKKNYQRRARKTSHDVAIDLLRGSMSYPTFILLFGDSLKANMPLKGFQKVPDLYGYLAFIAEGIYNTSRNVAGFVGDFKKVYTPGYEADPELVKWLGFEEAVTASARDKKKTFIHIAHPNSVASNLMDKIAYRDPSTAKKINDNFNSVKFIITEQGTINYNGQELKNVGGIHQLAMVLSQNQLQFPMFAILDSDGNLITKVPQYFFKTEVNPVLDFFIEEGYRNGTYTDWIKTKKK